MGKLIKENNTNWTRKRMQAHLETVLDTHEFTLDEKWLDTFLIFVHAEHTDTTTLYKVGQLTRKCGFTLTGIAVGYDYNRRGFTYYLKPSRTYKQI